MNRSISCNNKHTSDHHFDSKIWFYTLRRWSKFFVCAFSKFEHFIFVIFFRKLFYLRTMSVTMMKLHVAVSVCVSMVQFLLLLFQQLLTCTTQYFFFFESDWYAYLPLCTAITDGIGDRQWWWYRHHLTQFLHVILYIHHIFVLVWRRRQRNAGACRHWYLNVMNHCNIFCTILPFSMRIYVLCACDRACLVRITYFSERARAHEYYSNCVFITIFLRTMNRKEAKKKKKKKNGQMSKCTESSDIEAME